MSAVVDDTNKAALAKLGGGEGGESLSLGGEGGESLSLGGGGGESLSLGGGG